MHLWTETKLNFFQAHILSDIHIILYAATSELTTPQEI